MQRSSPSPRTQLWPLALLFLAGVGFILLATVQPSFVRQVPSVFHSRTLIEVPAISFKDEQGRLIDLAKFRGRVVLLNVWATWCTPCREEMPALDRLQAKLGGANFEVVALSVDRAGMNAVEAFFKAVDIRHLKPYIDENDTTMHKLGIAGLPTTLLIDRDGRDVARIVGAAEWDKEEFAQLIRKAMARQEQ